MIDLVCMAQDFESQPGKYHPLRDYRVGQRVQTHPATGTWMRGDRYGTVEHVGTKLVTVKMDRSERSLRFHPDNLIIV